MSADLWVGAVTTLAGAALGGSITLVLNRQRMRFEQAQRQEAAQEERYRRSVDRRFDAYSDFLTHSRVYQDSIRAFADDRALRPDIAQIDDYAQSANTDSALVFLVTESAATHDACRLVISTMGKIQDRMHDLEDPADVMGWIELNREMAGVLRRFQVAARTELGVSGVDASAILERRSPGA